MPDSDAAEPDIAQEEPERTFDRLVDEGEQRLGRSWPGLLATGLMGGLDVGAGVLALLLVEHLTGSPVLGGLAFAIGFIALTLARSELFTEDFLVPVAAVAAKRGSVGRLLRLWSSTFVTNLASGWIISFLVISAFPELREAAIKAATHYVELGTSWRTFALALIGGMLITLMTHLQHGTDSDGVRLVPAIAIGFVLGAGQVDHAIVASLICFSGILAGAPFGYLDWLDVLWLAVIGNLVGGLGLVTLLRLLQVTNKIIEERAGSQPSG